MFRYLLIVLIIALLSGGAYFNSVLLFVAAGVVALFYVADALDVVDKEEADDEARPNKKGTR